MDPASSMNSFCIGEYYSELENHTSELLKKSDKKIHQIEKKEKKWNKAFKENLPVITFLIAKQILDATYEGFSDMMVEPKRVEYRFYSKSLDDVSTTIKYYNLKNTAPFCDWDKNIEKKLNKILKDLNKDFSRLCNKSSSEEDNFLLQGVTNMMQMPVKMEEKSTLHTRQYFRKKFEILAINVNLVVATQIAKMNNKFKSRFIIVQNLVQNEDHDYHITISIKPPSSESLSN